jgi:hypothetical protein
MEAILSTRSPVGPFTETTTAKGKIPVDLSGVWLVVVHTRPSPEKAPNHFQSFVQLVKITDGAGSNPAFHMLDVQLPAPIQAEIDKAKRTLTPWQPTPAQLETLKQAWPSLPPYTEKDLNQNIFHSIAYTLVSPEHYEDSLKVALPPELLDKSAFALRVMEAYRPAQVPKESPVHIAQLAARDSVYAFPADGAGAGARLNGQAFLTFTAVGAGFPVPLSFGGRIQMHRLGSASATP